ncbi:MAG: ABC transporter permease [Nanobdellota archaeon]
MKSRKSKRSDSLEYKLNLIKELAWADFKLKYQGSLLGLFWTLLKPFLMLMVLYLVFDKFLVTGIENYHIYLLIGIIFWNFFADGTKDSMSSIRGKSAILNKTNIPPSIVILSTCLHSLMTTIINIAIFFVVLIALGEPITGSAFTLIYLLVMAILLVISVSFINAILYMRFTDFSHIWDVLIQVLFWATPIVYSQEMIPAGYHELFMLNPIARIIVDARNTLIYNFTPEFKQLFITFALITGLLMISIFIFNKYNRKLVDRL